MSESEHRTGEAADGGAKRCRPSAGATAAARPISDLNSCLSGREVTATHRTGAGRRARFDGIRDRSRRRWATLASVVVWQNRRMKAWRSLSGAYQIRCQTASAENGAARAVGISTTRTRRRASRLAAPQAQAWPATARRGENKRGPAHSAYRRASENMRRRQTEPPRNRGDRRNRALREMAGWQS